MPSRRVADVTISLYWEQRTKRWTATVSGIGHTEWLSIDTTVALDQEAAWLVLKAIEREMLSMLPLEQS